ncbi:alkanesulfonate monooxygenase SsuD/methylene tetrahydromethanopterin reductase-like flavin-dependent oxidoreductase (luciferase family) [Pseudomonas alcaligenes]|nr:alkanesulfonate monooxygenase SsuD/methylene tetrahydromethanopterin reductase-like flavin-dependent oxidoreductase (luciferase family) [Pseudomonas alcaligenes]
MQQRQHQAAEIEEFAGKNIREAAALAERYGYYRPVFTEHLGSLWVLGFKRHQAQQVA